MVQDFTVCFNCLTLCSTSSLYKAAHESINKMNKNIAVAGPETCPA